MAKVPESEYVQPRAIHNQQIHLAEPDPGWALDFADVEAAGFVLHIREPDWQQHRLLKGRDPDVNLHVFTTGSPEAERLLLFRDWLRSHPDEREVYARVKKELAIQEWEYVQDYADAKATVVEEILARARCGP